MADDAANELAKIAFDKKIELAEKQEKDLLYKKYINTVPFSARKESQSVTGRETR